MGRIVNTLNTQPDSTFLASLLPTTAKDRSVDRTEFVATEFHGLLLHRALVFRVDSKPQKEMAKRGWLDVLGVWRYYRAGNSILRLPRGSTMERVDRLRRGFFSNQLSRFGWRISL